MTRTLAFVIAASASVIGAVVAHIVTRPSVPTEQAYTRIGEEFYPDFADPTKATAIRVSAWNPRSNRVEQFEVRYENGRWRIPSHNDYPADGKDQLAKAAASAVGIVRGSLVSESADTFERLGVVDPLDESATQGAGVSGTRITLYEGDEILADYVVGHRQGDITTDAATDEPASDDEAGKQSKEGRFYVRRPDEKLVYLADVNIDVSTKFRDWIEKDLLGLSQFDLRKIVINRYSVDEDKGELIRGDINELSRESSSDPWKLAGLDESKERIKTGVVSAMARALDNLQIVGIRKKPAALVKFFNEGVVDLVTALTVQSDLQRHGFFFDGQNLFSNEGEVIAGTKDGISYVLRFGEVFTGSDLEVEVGTASADASPAGEGETATGDAAADTAAAQDDDGDDANVKRSRYVIVEAMFDPSLLGPEPTPPVKPTPPAGDAAPAAPAETPASPDNQKPANGDEAAASGDAPKPAADAAKPNSPDDAPASAPEPSTDGACDDAPAAEDAAPEAADKPAETPDAAADPAAADAPAADPAADGDKPAVRPRTPQDEYEEALKQYEQDLETYEAQKADYEKRLKEGQARVDELNKRFSEWYYVISAELFEDLHVSRDQLVEPVDPPAETEPGTGATPSTEAPSPGAPTTSAPATEPAAADPVTDKPGDEASSPAAPEGSPAAEAPKPNENPAEEPSSPAPSPTESN